jgi:hypothetical protein
MSFIVVTQLAEHLNALAQWVSHKILHPSPFESVRRVLHVRDRVSVRKVINVVLSVWKRRHPNRLAVFGPERKLEMVARDPVDIVQKRTNLKLEREVRSFRRPVRREFRTGPYGVHDVRETYCARSSQPGTQQSAVRVERFFLGGILFFYISVAMSLAN